MNDKSSCISELNKDLKQKGKESLTNEICNMTLTTGVYYSAVW